MVDNGSREDILSICQQYGDIRYLVEPIASSYRARNRGIEISRGEFLAFTDADCLPDENWLSLGVDRLMRNPKLDLIGGQVTVFSRCPEEASPVELYEMVSAFPQHLFVSRWNFAVTANLFVRRQVFEACGSFHPDLKSGGDLEWGQRATSAGFVLEYAPEVLILHPPRSSVFQLLSKARRIQGGLHDLRNLKGNLPLLPYLGSSLVSWPSISECCRLLEELDIDCALTKLRVCTILLAYRATRFLESLWLLFGASSRRS